jgi:hypothetical protein
MHVIVEVIVTNVVRNFVQQSKMITKSLPSHCIANVPVREEAV